MKKQNYKIISIMIPRDILIHYVCPLLYYTEDSETLKQMGVSEEDADKWCYHIKPHGEYKGYDSTGLLQWFYKEGNQHGRRNFYNYDGSIRSEYYINNLRHGEWYNYGKITYYINGERVTKLRYMITKWFYPKLNI